MSYTFGLLSFAIVTQALGQSGSPFQVVADYPAGCHGGPGPGEGSNITDLLKPSCIYNMKGVTSEGVIKEAAGIILNTNRPGRYGSMHVKVTVFTRPGTEGGALVETYGWAHLSVGDETRDFWWNPAPANNAFLPGVPIHIATIDYGSIPNANVSTWTSWHRLEGTADSKGLSLEASEKTFSNKRYPDFFTGQQIIATKRNGGWDYMVKYRFRAYPAKFKEYIKYVIRGNLQDKK